MDAETLAVAVFVYGFACWLGMYLIGRDPRSPRLRLTGAGLVAYALALASDLLAEAAAPDLARALARVRWTLVPLPALCWTGALIHLLPEESVIRDRLLRWWRTASALLVVLLLGVGFGTDLAVEKAGDRPEDAVQLVLGTIVLLPLLAVAVLVWRARWEGRLRRALGPAVVLTLFFGLSTGLLLVPHGWPPRPWALLLVGVDLIALGVAIARFDAFDQGEALLPDMLRSFDAALLAALLFGGQVALAMAIVVGATVPMIALLLGTVAAAVAVPSFADALGSAIDRVALGGRPHLRVARAQLRATASALPRVEPGLDLELLDDAEFARLTRRALSHFGDLPRLSASPLTFLPVVERRLAARGASDGALERAAELKAVLAESIARLKPRTGAAFGTSDEWRHYNALYFPYVVGLKPYRRRVEPTQPDVAAREALAWFRADVPERTLYNWQTAAARLVAQDLRRRDGSEPSPARSGAENGTSPPVVGPRPTARAPRR